MTTWDRERVGEILIDAIQNENDEIEEAISRLEEFVSQVRAEAVGWTWTEACAQYDQGRDPRAQEMPELWEKAKENLNPDR